MSQPYKDAYAFKDDAAAYVGFENDPDDGHLRVLTHDAARNLRDDLFRAFPWEYGESSSEMNEAEISVTYEDAR